ncbi:hypothetical protein TIFTF001_051078, partial [Ficus carica]
GVEGQGWWGAKARWGAPEAGAWGRSPTIRGRLLETEKTWDEKGNISYSKKGSTTASP